MRKPDRIKIVLEQIEQLWMSNPDFRFSQLVMVIAQTGEHNPKIISYGRR